MSPTWEEKRNVGNDGKEKIMLKVGLIDRTAWFTRLNSIKSNAANRARDTLTYFILVRTNNNKIISWTNFYHLHWTHGFCQNFKYVTGFVFYLFCSLVGVELPLCIVATLS